MRRTLAEITARLHGSATGCPRRRRISVRKRRPGPPPPRLLLMTDDSRNIDWTGALRALPPGAAIIIRHYGLPLSERLAFAESLYRDSRRHHVALIWSGKPRDARRLKADGVHITSHGSKGRRGRLRRHTGGARPLWLTTAAHGPQQVRAGHRLGADCVTFSPIFATRSHPNARCLGVNRFGLQTRSALCPVIALGGITGQTAKRIIPVRHVHGFAAIDGLTEAP